MTPDLRIQMAILLGDPRGVRIVAQTDDFDALEAERIAVLFGARTSGIACPLAHFACPFGEKHVAVVRVEDRPGEILGFRFLVLARNLYNHLGDPFAISDRYPPDWTCVGRVPDLAWPMEVLPERSLEQLEAILKRGDVGLLLGAAQALVDENHFHLIRVEPAEEFVRDLWLLLPDRTRSGLWPATFAFSNELGFHAAVLPPLTSSKPLQNALTEESLRNYPESSYELSLQTAIESGNRAALRALLARRTANETIRIGLTILAFALVAAVVLKCVF